MKKLISAKLAGNLLLFSLGLLFLFHILVLLKRNTRRYRLGRTNQRRAFKSRYTGNCCAVGDGLLSPDCCS